MEGTTATHPPTIPTTKKAGIEEEQPMNANNTSQIKDLLVDEDRVVELMRHRIMNEVESDIVYDKYLDCEDDGKKCFYDEEDWNDELRNIVSTLEANYEVIKGELHNICENDFMKWPEKICKSGWKVFGLYGFGRKLEQNTVKCPKTTEIIERLLPCDEITTVGFSSLDPGTYITPHKGYDGYSDNILRLHLALIVPKDKCGIRVGNCKRSWKEGKCLIFDDFITHEAWNFGEYTRINLLMDIKYLHKSYMLKKNSLLIAEREEKVKKAVDCKNASFSVGLKCVLDKIDANKDYSEI